MLKKLKSKSFKNILSKVYAWKWPTQYISEWLSKKQRENEILKIEVKKIKGKRKSKCIKKSKSEKCKLCHNHFYGVVEETEKASRLLNK